MYITQGGLKVVELQGGAARQLAGWMHELGHVAAEAFDVSYYTVTSRHAQAQLVFYGVETNAGCAAYAPRMPVLLRLASLSTALWHRATRRRS